MNRHGLTVAPSGLRLQVVRDDSFIATHGFRHLLGRGLVAAKGAKTYSRHRRSCLQDALWHSNRDPPRPHRGGIGLRYSCSLRHLSSPTLTMKSARCQEVGARCRRNTKISAACRLSAPVYSPRVAGASERCTRSPLFECRLSAPVYSPRVAGASERCTRSPLFEHDVRPTRSR